MNTARINLTVPKEVHTAARIYAVQHGMTLAQVITEALRRLLDPEQSNTGDAASGAANQTLCPWGCGRPVLEGRRLCAEHLAHQRRKMADYRADRKQRGLCSRCPNWARSLTSGESSTLCDHCREKVRSLERRNAHRVRLAASQRKAS